jgi:hypothetical protein
MRRYRQGVECPEFTPKFLAKLPNVSVLLTTSGMPALAWLDVHTGATMAAGKFRHLGGNETLLAREAAKRRCSQIIDSRNQ